MYTPPTQARRAAYAPAHALQSAFARFFLSFFVSTRSRRCSIFSDRSIAFSLSARLRLSDEVETVRFGLGFCA